jgi:hypothetical protein
VSKLDVDARAAGKRLVDRSPLAFTVWAQRGSWLHHVLMFVVAALAGIGGYTLEDTDLLHALVGLVGLGAVAMTYLLARLSQRAGDRRAACEPVDPETVAWAARSRRLRHWEGTTRLLLIPGTVLVAFSEILSLVVLVALGISRYLIRRLRRASGDAVDAMGLIPGLVYGGLLLVALSGTILRALGR